MTRTKRGHHSSCRAVVAAVFFACTTLATASEEKVDIQALPEVVKSTVEANAPGGTIEEAELETADGMQVYSIEVKKTDGTEVELEIAPDGKLLKVEQEDDADDNGPEEAESKIEPGQTPPAIQLALKRFVPEGVTSITLTREREHGAEVYEVEYVQEGITHALEFTASGALMEQETRVSAGSLPSEVSAALARKFPGAQVAEAEEVSVRFYEVTVVQNGTKHEVKVSPAGKIWGTKDHEDDANEDDD